MIYRITDPHDWDAAQVTGSFASADLRAEGFIHCCTVAQIVAVANRYYQGHKTLLVLAIDDTGLTADLRWEDLTGSGQVYPHVYGPIPLTAVHHTLTLTPGLDGVFTAHSLRS
jgi:uncharacterized protein (DUF952 family)